MSAVGFVLIEFSHSQHILKQTEVRFHGIRGCSAISAVLATCSASVVLLKAFLRHSLCNYLQYWIALSFADQNYFVTSILFAKTTIINQFNNMRLKNHKSFTHSAKLPLLSFSSFPLSLWLKRLIKQLVK